MSETFEEKIKAMKTISPEEMDKRVKEIKNVCKSFCGDCPTYTGAGETQLGFCAVGKSNLIKEKKGCLCVNCPITKAMSLRWDYYCTWKWKRTVRDLKVDMG
jgi:hypothetical protein